MKGLFGSLLGGKGFGGNVLADTMEGMAGGKKPGKALKSGVMETAKQRFVDPYKRWYDLIKSMRTEKK